MLKYEPFDLLIDSGRDRKYPVSVLGSPAGEASAVMQLPFDEIGLEQWLAKIEATVEGLESGAHESAIRAQEFGRLLFDALISGEVRTRYDVSLSQVEHEGKGLRVKLRVRASDLAILPWELLFDVRRNSYLALSVYTPLVRYLEIPRTRKPLNVELPLRILGMIASPEGIIQLDVERERKRIEEATATLRQRGAMVLEWTKAGTLRELQRALRTGTWHLFHFIGHGGFDSEDQTGVTAFEDESGRPQFIRASSLAQILGDHRPLRLVVLNSCDSGRQGQRNRGHSVATALITSGIPAVLAMQYKISDQVATELTRSFYEILADGNPVDVALAEARKTISMVVPGSMEWAVPVMHMRTSDGILFELADGGAVVSRAAGKAKAQTPLDGDSILFPQNVAEPDRSPERVATREADEDEDGRIIRFPRDQVSRSQRPGQPIAEWFKQILSQVEAAQREFNARTVPEAFEITKVYAEVNLVLSSIYQAMEQINELYVWQNRIDLMDIRAILENRKEIVLTLLDGIAQNLLELQMATLSAKHARTIHAIRNGLLRLQLALKSIVEALESL